MCPLSESTGDTSVRCAPVLLGVETRVRRPAAVLSKNSTRTVLALILGDMARFASLTVLECSKILRAHCDEATMSAPGRLHKLSTISAGLSVHFRPGGLWANTACSPAHRLPYPPGIPVTMAEPATVRICLRFRSTEYWDSHANETTLPVRKRVTTPGRRLATIPSSTNGCFNRSGPTRRRAVSSLDRHLNIEQTAVPGQYRSAFGCCRQDSNWDRQEPS